jgi:SAM-dependent methyltransferase
VLFAAAPAVGPTGHVTGIDLAGRMVELTAAEVAARGLTQVTVQWGDAEDPGFPAASFDAVLGSLVLFFLPDPVAALRRYATLLAPGGRLGFTSFAAVDEHFEAALGAVGRFVPGGLPDRGDRQGPFGSPAGITDLLAAGGFAPEAIVERDYVTRFRDPDEWLRWEWSHGGRATLERVPAEVLPAATAAAKKRFAGARTDRGDYAITTTIRMTLARPATG